MRFVVAIIAMILPATGMSATPRVGDTFEIRHEYETEDKTEDGTSSGSSSGHTTILERVTEIRADGLELEYDFPSDTSEGDRSREWQFPARIFRPFSGTPQLLNRADLEARRDAWLRKWKIDPGVCGSWYFTWNAFKVECDPQSIVAGLEEYNLWMFGLDEGVPYRTPQALEAAPLKRVPGSNPPTFVAEFTVDPDKLRQERAEADVVFSQITGKPRPLEETLRARSSEKISGTIAVTFYTDGSGQVQQRTELVKLNIRGADGTVETKTRTETVRRHLISARSR